MLIPLDMPDANTRISNLKQATADYTAEYSMCKCKPCQNGGTLTLLDGSCMCLCTNLYEGKACQNFKSDKAGEPSKSVNAQIPNSQNYITLFFIFNVCEQCFAETRPPVVQEGNWLCWSPWSSCSEGKRTRTRGCNTQGLTGGSCRGDSSSQDYC